MEMINLGTGLSKSAISFHNKAKDLQIHIINERYAAKYNELQSNYTKKQFKTMINHF